MTVDRSVVRKMFAARLDLRLMDLVEKVYNYQAADFKGASPVVIVTTGRSERGNQKVAVESYFVLEVHTFVLYALKPVQYDDLVSAGTDVVIPLEDTSMFQIGLTVTLEDDTNTEESTVTDVVDNVSITVDETLNSYTNPKLYVWTESQSEDLVDQLEYEISDEIRISNDDDIWLSIETDGETTIDVVEIGGEAYRHETIPIRVCVEDF